MVTYNLISEGYDTVSALNVGTAAERLVQTKYDLVLLDINLPDGNGYDLPLGEALREELAAIPGVDYVTAYSMACVEIPAISGISGNREHEPFIVRGIDQEDMTRMYTDGAILESGMQGELKRDYCLLFFIFVFSLINLANTLITNLLARQQEFGVFQSVGMSGRQMAEMLSCECLYYIGVTLLVTMTVGTVCSLAMCHIFDQAGMFGKLTYHFPVLQVLVFAAALLLVQMVFSACAVRYSRRFSLVERIKATD